MRVGRHGDHPGRYPAVAGLYLGAAILSTVAAGQTPTVTTLKVIPDSALASQPVTLTASISPAVDGKVMFFDGTSILGVAPVTAGSATFVTTLLHSGTRNLQARYVASPKFQTSSSSVLRYPVTPRPSYALFRAAGSAFPAGDTPNSIVSGDLNGDGIADLAVANYGSSDVSVFLGDGKGAFTPASGSPFAAARGPSSIAAGDFDGDGNTDLAIANSNANSVTLLLGDGRGRFAPAAASPLRLGGFGSPNAVTVGDFNTDGIADLAVARGLADDILIFLGDGTGGFNPAPGRASRVDQLPLSIALGDFNADGNADLAVASLFGNSVAVLLGDGLGAFTRTRGSYVFLFPYSVVVGDFNGDGQADLAVAQSGGVNTLLGDGQGAFALTDDSPFFTGTSNNFAGVYSALAAGDLDGDGNPDVAVAMGADFQFAIGSVQSALLLGDGQGGLVPAAWSPITFASSSNAVVIADFNGDGRSDVAFANAADINVFLAGGGLTITERRPEPFVVGRSSTLLLIVENGLPETVSGEIKVVDDLPRGLAPTAAGGPGWTCGIGGQKVTCTRSGELSGRASHPPIEVIVNVSGAACQAVSPSVLNAVNVAEVLVNDALVFTSSLTPAVSITGCLTVGAGAAGDLVVNRPGTYTLTVSAAEDAEIPRGYPVQVSLLAAGLLAPSATGEGWSCTSNGQFMNCRTTTRGDQYTPITVTGAVQAAACPTAISQAILLAADSVQDTSVLSTDLYGCLRVDPPNFDVGVISFNAGVIRNFTVTSTDKHPLTLTADGRYLLLDFSNRLNPCASLDTLSFGQSCYLSIGLNSCTEPPDFTLTLRVDGGNGRVAEYPLAVRTRPAPDQLAIVVTGAVNQQVTPGTPYPVAVTVTPAPDPIRCPQNVLPTLDFDFSPPSPEPAARFFDASFNPAGPTLNPGTVAGSITLTAKSQGQDVKPRNGSNSVTLTVPKLPGVIQRVSLRNQRDSSVQVDITAYSTPREVGDSAKTELCLEFLTAPGAVLDPGGQFCALKDEIRIWYERSVSYAYGSRFLGSITASFTGDKAAIGGIKVVLRNMMGDSAPYCVDFKSGNQRDCP